MPYGRDNAFTRAVAHYVGDWHIAPGAAPGCPGCLTLDEECQNPDHDPDGCPGEWDDCHLVPVDLDNWRDLANEPSFSKSQCDTCGTTIDGDRHPAHMWANGSAETHHVEICTDCTMFFANGELPEEWYPSAHTRRAAELEENPIDWDLVPWVDSRYYD